MRRSPTSDTSYAGSSSVQVPDSVTTPPLPYPSSNKPSALSSRPLLLHRNPCSCSGWDRSHTAVLALAVAGIAVELEVATGAGIARLLLVIAVAKLRSGGDVVDTRGSIARVGGRKVRLRERRRSMCQRYSRRPWWSEWVLVGFLCKR